MSGVPLERRDGAVLCLVEDEHGVGDPSLRALTFARASCCLDRGGPHRRRHRIDRRNLPRSAR